MRILCVFFIFSLAACQSQLLEKSVMTPDPHSYANSENVVVKHLSWTAAVDFEKQRITSKATWTIEKKDERAAEIMLDTKSLRINRVTLDDDQATEFSLGADDPIRGQALRVQLTPKARRINIYYETNPGSEALQWLSPRQTAGKKHPFLFTQSQAILARSWIPCQDSPGIRFTYDATVSVPAGLTALMSASNPQQKNDSGLYSFEMKEPIPSYLLALTVGDISFKPLSERCGVYAEPVTLEAAAWEFADLEKMIRSAEELYGEYRWDRYDVIVLPPSFPFGGMENPRLTFVTPTLLAGDRSLISVIAHELAHSWSGNLVTNKTWNDFWLNEGFTVYFEMRIMEKLYGTDYAEMLASLNLHDLKKDMADIEAGAHPEDTRLKLDLSGRNPDEAATDVAYNKGYFFLRSIEEKYGREKFDAFLRDYFKQNAFSVMDTESFIGLLNSYYKNEFNVTIEDSLTTKWIYAEGLPAGFLPPQSDRFSKVEEAVRLWQHDDDVKSLAEKWSTQEWLHFLHSLPASLSSSEMKQLDNLGNFTATGNAEIFDAWAVIAVRNNYEPAFASIREFLIHTGRRKFLTPIYTEMIKTEQGKAFARSVYEDARPNYHFVATSTMDKLLSFDPATP
jgi:leukotriene A-4 hydrolase/aminopeptidase